MRASSPPDTPQPIRRSRVLRPIRLSTFLLVVVVIGLLIAVYAQRVREAQLRDTISVYRHPRTEGIYDALDQPIALTYADDAPLEAVLKDIKLRTTTNPSLPQIPTGLPLYVDPIGLQEAERTLSSTVKRPPSADTLTLGEHLRLVLDPLGLGYQVQEGYLMITSKEEADVPGGDDADPYPRYRDVLR